MKRFDCLIAGATVNAGMNGIPSFGANYARAKGLTVALCALMSFLVGFPPSLATGEPSAPVPAGYSWARTEASLALRKRDATVWQLVHDAASPKSYFHPLATVDGEVLTAFEPSDHVWHRGLWWSWKFINGVN